MRERIEAILRGWDAIPGHRTGTADDTRTAEWLARAIEATGAAATIETFSFMRRTPRTARLRLTDDGSPIEGLPCFDAPDTPARGIAGRLVPSGGPGEIGLLDYEPQGDGTAALERARRDTGHVALVAVCAGPSGRGLAVINADDYGRDFGPPVLQTGAEHAERLRAAAATASSAVLTITSERDEAEASNVGAVVAGRDPELAPVVVMTPRSGWWRCTSERGGGLVAWLETLRHFAHDPPLRDLRFTANTGHELGHLGLAHDLARQPALVGEAHCWIHLGANFAARDGRLILQGSSAELLTLGERLLRGAGAPPDITIPRSTAPFGEARNIYDGGGRYLSVLGSNPRFHHPDDRWPDAVDLDKTARVTRAVIGMVEALTNAR